jgi:hypothetical protein
MCLHCYDESNLSIKKKYKKVEAVEPNYESLLDTDPQKIKELTDLKEIEEMVDEYIKNDFEGVLSGGLKTKFRVIVTLYSISMFLKKISVSVTIRYCMEMIKN